MYRRTISYTDNNASCTKKFIDDLNFIMCKLTPEILVSIVLVGYKYSRFSDLIFHPL